MLKTLLVAAAGFVLTAASLSNGADDTTYVHAGHVLTVPGEGYRTQQTLVIKDGKITEVIAGYLQPKDGIEVVDLREAYVIPGLIDSHVHLLQERSPNTRLNALTYSEADYTLDGAMHAKRTLMSGFTTVQDVGGMGAAIFSLRDAIDQGKVPGPRIKAAGMAITPTGGHGDANGFSPVLTRVFSGPNACDGADDCRRAVRQAIKEGADVIKITATGGVLSNTAAGIEQQFFDDELAAIVEAAESMGRKVTAHAHGKQGIEAALRAGVHSIEHGTYLDGETIRLFRRNDAVLVPTVLAGVTVTGWASEPWLPEPSRVKAAEVGPRMLDMLTRARQGGVTVAFGTDTGVSRHGDNAKEFELMVQAGFSPEAAIRSATVIAAQHMNLGDTIGTLEVGKEADLIALDNDPLMDVTELMDVDFVMKGGTIHKSEL